MTKAKRNHKDTIFRLIFKEKENFLSLYNAVNKTHYTNADELRINTLEEAVEKAIEECIRKDILADFLKKNRAEAMEVCLYEYNEEQHLKEERDIAKEEGIRIGQKRGEEIGQERVNTLNRLLAEHGRTQDILEAARDLEYQKKLMKEFGL